MTTFLVFLGLVLVGSAAIALVLNASAERREAERSRRHLENLRRVSGRRDCGDTR